MATVVRPLSLASLCKQAAWDGVERWVDRSGRDGLAASALDTVSACTPLQLCAVRHAPPRVFAKLMPDPEIARMIVEDVGELSLDRTSACTPLELVVQGKDFFEGFSRSTPVRERADADVVRLLIWHGASVYRVNCFGECVLHLAVRCGAAPDVVEAVLAAPSREHGGEAELRARARRLLTFADAKGRTPIVAAREAGRRDLVEVMTAAALMHVGVADGRGERGRAVVPRARRADDTSRVAALPVWEERRAGWCSWFAWCAPE